MQKVEVLVIGAGAAGLMCAIEAGKRGRKVVIVDHANKPGKKIIMSGGGRCNFTNETIHPDKYLSHNRHFCKSALKRYTQWDFIELVCKHKIAYHEKEKGQLFCDHKSKDIVDMLLKELELANAELILNCSILKIEKISDSHFIVKTSRDTYHTQSLVIATGGLSIPTMGASPFGYQVAEQFGIPLFETRAGLVPVTLQPKEKEKYATLSGVAVDAKVTSEDETVFLDPILFTHRGLSGPGILQISSYWQYGQWLKLDLYPKGDLLSDLVELKRKGVNTKLKTVLSELFPKKVVNVFIEDETLLDMSLQDISHKALETVANAFQQWAIKPGGTEGYRTAEVTLGGVDCDYLSSKTMECLNVKGLYFIGEIVDVTGWLGGYNFQWAWSSGWAAGQLV